MSVTYRPRREPRHEERTLRGLRHRLTWWGEPCESPIVLLHGFLDAGATWQFLVDCLPDSWSFVAPDLRGCGGTERAPGGYWFPDYLADLEALLDALVPNAPARLMGHSMGGNIASLYAGVRPDRVAWLVNLEGFGLPRTEPDQAAARFAEWLDQLRQGPRVSRYDSVERFAAVLRTRNPRLTLERSLFIAHAWTRPVENGVELAADPLHRLVNPVLYRREEAESCWRRIKAPSLLLIGELSELRERLGADGTEEALRAAFPGARLRTVPGVGHMMHHEDPQAVAERIVEFVAEQGNPR
ncbi:MAG: alpha/beta hydrolase [Pseudomonadota bacterium]